jgi:hypothetical protein
VSRGQGVDYGQAAALLRQGACALRGSGRRVGQTQVACPVCHLGRVAVGEAAWSTPTGTGHSVWADEPVRCHPPGKGCVLTPLQVRRLLLDLRARSVRQLALEVLEDARPQQR